MCDSSDEESFINYGELGVASEKEDNLEDLLQNNPSTHDELHKKKRRRKYPSVVTDSSSDDECQIALWKKPKRTYLSLGASTEHGECSSWPANPPSPASSPPPPDFKSMPLSRQRPSEITEPEEQPPTSSTAVYLGQDSPPSSSCITSASENTDMDIVPPLSCTPLNYQDVEWISEFSQCSTERRLTLLTTLVRHCSHQDLVHLQMALQPFLRKDFIAQLPPEIGLKILTCLPPKDLLTCAKVSCKWRKIAEDDLLWWHKCHSEGVVRGFFSSVYKTWMSCIPAEKPSCPSASNCQTIETTSTNSGDETSSDSFSRGILNLGRELPTGNVSWKKCYLRRRRLKCNWRKGTSRSRLVLRGHQNHVITCLEFYKNKVISASDDATIKIWSLETGECVRTLYGHIGGVWSSVMVGDLLVSGSTDRSVRVWDLEKEECIAALFGHVSTVRCLASSGRLLVSGSRDTNLRLWDVDQAKCLHVLQGHRAAVRCVQFVDKRVVSGSYDYTVRVWDADTAECIHVLSGHLNRVYTLVFDGRWIASGSLDTTIRVWDPVTGSLVQTLYGHESLTSGMELVNNLLVSSNADATIRVWDIHTGQCCQLLAGPNKHSSAVTCVQVTDDLVISASDDGTVKLWELKSGTFLCNLIRLDSGGSGGVVWRILASETRLVCAAGSRNGAEDTKLVVMDFEGEALPQLTSTAEPPEATSQALVLQRRRTAGEQTLSDLLKYNTD